MCNASLLPRAPTAFSRRRVWITLTPFNVSVLGAGVMPVCIHRKVDGSEAYCEFESVPKAARAMTQDKVLYCVCIVVRFGS